MRNLSKVVWSEGMHLSVHHFQAQSKYFEDSIYFAASALWFAAYGLIDIDLDHKAIESGRVVVRHARGTLMDGLPFSMPEADPIVDDLDIRPLIAEVESSVTVCLGAPAYRPDGPNCADGDTAVRYTSETLTMFDENTGRDEKTVSLGRKNLRLYVEKQPVDGFVGIPVARVIRVSSGFTYDPNFIPPCLQIISSKRLMQMVERLIEKLEEKSSALAIHNQGRGSSPGGFSSGEISGFWFLNTLNSTLPVLRHIWNLGSVHPEQLYVTMLRLAGSLCTFFIESKPESLPLYDHANLTQCFTALEKHIETHLDWGKPTNCLAIPLRVYADYFHAGKIEDDRCFGPSRWILSVRAGLGEADLISRVPKLVTVCSAVHVQKLVERALPGLPLTHLPSPPAAISPALDKQYFSITQKGLCWDHIKTSKAIGVYIPKDIPRAEIEVLIVT